MHNPGEGPPVAHIPGGHTVGEGCPEMDRLAKHQSRTRRPAAGTPGGQRQQAEDTFGLAPRRNSARNNRSLGNRTGAYPGVIPVCCSESWVSSPQWSCRCRARMEQVVPELLDVESECLRIFPETYCSMGDSSAASVGVACRRRGGPPWLALPRHWLVVPDALPRGDRYARVIRQSWRRAGTGNYPWKGRCASCGLPRSRHINPNCLAAIPEPFAAGTASSRG